MSAARTSLTVVTANIGRGESPTAAATNIDRVLTGFRGRPWRRTPAVIGWQEVDEADGPDEHAILRAATARLMPRAEIAGFRNLDPVVVPPGWKIIHQDTRLACKGRAKITPTRYIVIALIEHVGTGIQVAVLNGHYPHNAPDLWIACNQAWVREVELWTMHEGTTVVATRDRNMPGNGSPLSEWERPLLAPPSIDKISVIQSPKGVRVEAGKPRVVNMTVDGHNAHGVPLTLIARPSS